MSETDHPDTDDGDDRVTQLESKLTYLEHTVEVLASELEAQQTETRLLRRKLDGVQEQLESLGREPGGAQDNEPPPHY